MCDESSSEEGKTGKVIENDRIFSWVRLLDNECAPLLLGWLAALRIHSAVTVCRLLRHFAHLPHKSAAASRGVVVWGFRVSRCGAQNLLSFLFRRGRRGRCFEKIRTSCVYVWHRWRLEQTGNVFRYSDLMKWNSALGGILWLGRLISAVYDVVLSPIITSAPKSPP